MLPEVRGIAAGVSKAMLGEENCIGLFGPPRACLSYVGATKSPRQLALTTGPAYVFDETTHFDHTSKVNVAFMSQILTSHTTAAAPLRQRFSRLP